MNDSIETAIEAVPVFDINVDEIRIKFYYYVKKEMIFYLIMIEKFLGRLQQCTLGYIPYGPREHIFYLNLFIRYDDKRLKKIWEKLGDNFYIHA